ncbi:MAG: DUF190 domain-containing protein [Phycisphaeraceae bacterium]|nr:DUF190 domain-containing protein [Phycisphaeraceae bacterium]
MTTVEMDLLRVVVDESDSHKGQPVWEAVLHAARSQGLAGATVLRGVAGFGVHSRIHTSKILRLSEDLPMVVEMVDTPEKIEAFLPSLAAVGEGSLITIEKVRVVRR